MKKKLGIVLVVIFICNLLPISASAKKSGGGGILGFDSGNCKEISSEDGSSFTVCVTKNTPESELTRENFYQLQQAVKSLALGSSGKGVKKISSADRKFSCAETNSITTPTTPPTTTCPISGPGPCSGMDTCSPTYMACMMPTTPPTTTTTGCGISPAGQCGGMDMCSPAYMTCMMPPPPPAPCPLSTGPTGCVGMDSCSPAYSTCMMTQMMPPPPPPPQIHCTSPMDWDAACGTPTFCDKYPGDPMYCTGIYN